MLLHLVEFGFRELAGLAEDAVRMPTLPTSCRGAQTRNSSMVSSSSSQISGA
ncbi:MAG: hypothetical protein ACLRWP_08380 [Bilophila wadsworthia]